MKISVNKQELLVRHEDRYGKDYLVVPMVVLKQGVLNGEFVPEDEILRHFQAWNGRPVPIRHPKSGEDYVSANSIDVLNSSVIGHFFNATYEDGALKGEAWIDYQKAKTLGDEAAMIVQRLESGNQFDVSTGYWRDFDASPGEYGGIAYNGIARNLRPDHIAILPDEQGACSWKDGCGAPRVHSADSEFITHAVRNLVETFTGKRKKEMKEKLIADIAANSKMSKEQLEVLDEATLQALADSLVPADEKPETVTANSAAKVELPVEITEFATALRSIGGPSAIVEMFSTIKANADARKNEIVARLATNSKVQFSKDELAALDIKFLEKLDQAFTPADYSGRGVAFATNAFGSADSEWEAYVAPTVK